MLISILSNLSSIKNICVKSGCIQIPRKVNFGTKFSRKFWFQDLSFGVFESWGIWAIAAVHWIWLYWKWIMVICVKENDLLWWGSADKINQSLYWHTTTQWCEDIKSFELTLWKYKLQTFYSKWYYQQQSACLMTRKMMMETFHKQGWRVTFLHKSSVFIHTKWEDLKKSAFSIKATCVLIYCQVTLSFSHTLSITLCALLS